MDGSPDFPFKPNEGSIVLRRDISAGKFLSVSVSSLVLGAILTLPAPIFQHQSGFVGQRDTSIGVVFGCLGVLLGQIDGYPW